MERKLTDNTRQYLLKTIHLCDGDALTPEIAAEYAMQDDEELIYTLCEIAEYKSKVIDAMFKPKKS